MPEALAVVMLFSLLAFIMLCMAFGEFVFRIFPPSLNPCGPEGAQNRGTHLNGA